ncbi:MAG: hypothetical protein ACRDKJ_13815 [Actinomycetota bacterium]
MKKALATVMLALGVSGILATAAPPASAQQLICVDLYVRIGDTKLIDNQEICV